MFPSKIEAQAYGQPQPDWPCTQQTWETVMNAPEREIIFPPVTPTGGSGGGFNYPAYRERMRKIACDDQQIGTNRMVCLGY